mgnify:CR=1 FL=1
MKGYETQTALRAIGEAISAHEKQIKQHDTRIENLEKIVQSQAEDVMGLQLKVRELRDQNIKLAKEDGYYVVYKQLETNKTVIDKMTYLSNIPEFINNLKALSTQKNVFFNWFTYNNWKISTKVSVINDSVALASLKTKSFIEFFRNPNNHIFSLWFVNAFEWQDRINFNAEFSVK